MITQLISPSGNVSVQDSLWFIANSDNRTEQDFKYVFDLFEGDNQLIRAKVFPEPTTSKGYFDAAPVIRNEITFDWFTPVSPLATHYSSYLIDPDYSGQIATRFQIRVGEDFSGLTTLNLASGNTIAYNAAVPLFNRRVPKTVTTDPEWMTNRPLKATIANTDKLMVGIKCKQNKLTMNCKSYDINNTLINNITATYEYQTNLTGYDTPEYREFVQLDLGVDAVTKTTGNNVFNAAYYDISFGELKIDKFRIYLKCDRYDTVNLHFINALGMFDTAKFGLVKKLSLDLERKNFSRREFTLNATSVDYYNSNKVYNESRINFGSKIDWTYKLTMDYPSDAEYQWLSELIVSPQIYAEIDGAYYPVSIKATNYEYKEQNWAGLQPLEVEISLNQTRYGYRR
jgi:hypothetical protein